MPRVCVLDSWTTGCNLTQTAFSMPPPFDADIMESWAFATPARSLFMEAWLDEFVHAVSIGFDAYKALRHHSLPKTLLPSMPFMAHSVLYRTVSDQRGPDHRPSVCAHQPMVLRTCTFLTITGTLSGRFLLWAGPVLQTPWARACHAMLEGAVLVSCF